jgi:hypothetical protein
MTVNELIAELENIRERGHGDAEVVAHKGQLPMSMGSPSVMGGFLRIGKTWQWEPEEPGTERLVFLEP